VTQKRSGAAVRVAVLRCAWALVLTSGCTDKAVIGYDCPDGGCLPKSAPPASSNASPPASIRSDAGLSRDAADGCDGAVAEGCAPAPPDAGCGSRCHADPMPAMDCSANPCGSQCDPQDCDAGMQDACASISPANDEHCCTSDLSCSSGGDEVFCHPQEHRCVECVQDAQCNARKPFCVGHKCRSCQNEAACQAEMQCDGACEKDH
jgi:hypothetical protein